MNKLFLYNTLSRKKEEFKPINKKEVGLYTCGPTVYNYAHLGNLRAFLFYDILKRTLEYNGYKVKHIMNITDVGHLSGDRDMGEDKLELGAKREGKTAWEVASFYEQAFFKDIVALNIKLANLYAKATESIKEQIALIKVLEEKGYAYQISDGMYFNTALVKDYNKLSHLPLEELKEGARVEKNPEKKNPTDFALWKFSPKKEKRQMEWPSPWGIGFPGWHIECSAISLKYLQGKLDIHCGGIDHINVHHTNEIAQSEAATGQKFFNYWMHNAFLNISGGKKMAKSGDFLTLKKALLGKEMDPLAYRFAFLQVSYRKPMEYSEESLKRAAEGLNSLRLAIASLGEKKGKVSAFWRDKFLEAINNDLNMPQALALVSKVLKDKIDLTDKLATILDFDKVLGLNLDQPILFSEKKVALNSLSPEIRKIILNREKARQEKNWLEADRLREALKEKGYLIKDLSTGLEIRRKN